VLRWSRELFTSRRFAQQVVRLWLSSLFHSGWVPIHPEDCGRVWTGVLLHDRLRKDFRFWTKKESDRFLTRSAVFVMSIQHFGKGALRVAKNYTKGYSDVQAKARDATSNDPWGPSGTQMNEIAQMTYNQFVLTLVPLCFGSR